MSRNLSSDHRNDDYDEILLLENILSSDCKEKDYFDSTRGGGLVVVHHGESANNNFDASDEDLTRIQEKSEYHVDGKSPENDIEDFNGMLNFNKQIISFLFDLKKHITSALRKCDEKLTVVEASLQKHTGGDAKVLICNAGMPYFKDRNYFFPPNNEDDLLKENRGEMQVRNLPKVSLWTAKERNTFLKAIRAEAITDVVYSEKVRSTASDGITYKLKSENKEEKTRECIFPSNFQEIVGPLGDRDFDWLKVSSVNFDERHSSLDCRVMWNVFLHPNINKNSWKRPENTKLKEIATKHRFQNWEEIAKALGTARTAYQCFIRYNTTKKLPKARNCIWKNREDKRLSKLVEIYQIGDFIPWGQVASWMENRTKQQVYFRWIYSLAPYLIKGRFTKTEDNLLKDAIVKYGTNFCKISVALMPSRSTVQLHDHYQTLTANKIENLKKWTLAEDTKLLALFQQFGSNWSRIAKTFSCKTRTQVRHRYTALQKYIGRGISIFELHDNSLNDQNVKERAEEKEEETHENEIDQELIEYFYRTRSSDRSMRDSKLYTVEQPRCKARHLYDILRILNAKLCIPDDISGIELSDRDSQLLRSLKEYTRMRNDEERCFELVSKCSSRMFGTSYDREEEDLEEEEEQEEEEEEKGGSRFIPPQPFGSQINIKKSTNHELIDYTLSTLETFLLESPTEMNTPDFVIFYIGGNEQELQFQKLGRSLQSNSMTNQRQHSSQHLSGLSRKLIQTTRNSNLARRVGSSTVVDSESECYEQRTGKTETPLDMPFESKQYFSSTSDTGTIRENKVYAIEPSHTTLSSFQNLMYLKRLKEKCGSFDPIRIKSKKFHEAYDLFETRLEQLFKYPICLSKTVLPEVYVMDTFSYNDTTSKRKAYQASNIFKKHQTKKLQSFNEGSRDKKISDRTVRCIVPQHF